MSIPHFNNNIDYSLEPIYRNLFDVEYSCSNITKEELDHLKKNTHKIKQNKIFIHVNDNNKTTDILQKMDIFTIVLKTHDRKGLVFGKYIYSNCRFKNIIEDMVDFDWDEKTILIPNFEFNYESLVYITLKEFLKYERTQKLKRILS